MIRGNLEPSALIVAMNVKSAFSHPLIWQLTISAPIGAIVIPEHIATFHDDSSQLIM
jgi:hypothetical protein